MKLPIIAVALFAATAATTTTATALPALKNGVSADASQSNIVEHVRHNRWHKKKRWRRHHHDDWRHDYRYRKYRSWSRYDYRPYRWRHRGCVHIGPLWFCP